MYKRETWIIVFLLLSSVLILPAQSIRSTSSILESARQDPAVTLQEDHIKLINNTNQRLPFAEQFSLRTESDRFMVDRQEYLARMSVNGISEMQKQKLLAAAQLQAENQQERVYLHHALADRYDAIAAYMYWSRKKSLQETLRLTYEDNVQVFKKMVALDMQVDVDELIKVEYDLDELELDLAESNARIAQLTHAFAEWTGDAMSNIQVDTTDLISVERINSVLTQLPPCCGEHPEVGQKEAKVNEIDAAYALEKASGQRMLDFVQLRYANRPLVTDLAREFSFGFGINFPYRGSSRVKLGELKIEKDNEDQNRQLYLIELTRLVDEARREIGSLTDRYQLSKQQWEESQLRYTLKHEASVQADGPQLLLKVHEMQLKRELAQNELEREIREHYLHILDWTGSLSMQPAVNYLSEGLNPLPYFD